MPPHSTGKDDSVSSSACPGLDEPVAPKKQIIVEQLNEEPE